MAIELHGEPLIIGTRLSLRVTSDSIGGFSGCNDYGGPRSPLAENALAVERMASTAQGCLEPPVVLDQEQAFQNAVQSAHAVTVAGDALELLDPGGNVIVRLEREPQTNMNPADLVGTTWNLIELGEFHLPGDAGITLAIEDASELRGYTGCRTYTSAYVAERDDIYLTMLGMDATECHREEPYATAENICVSMLGEARRYRIEGDVLQIFDRRGNVLVFREALC